MNPSKKVRILFLSALIYSLYLQSSNYFNLFLYFNDNLIESNLPNLKINGYWNLTGSPIYIDGTGITGDNWTWAVSQPWCSGSGTFSDPFIIENVTIDGLRLDNCIHIINTIQSFIIQNCYLYDSGSSWNYAGIKISDSQNGKIIKNNFTLNHAGIFLESATNMTIVDNTANNNAYGIILEYSNNNSFSENVANYNHGGFYIEGNYNTITNNTFVKSRQEAICIEGKNNKLSNNIMIECGILTGESSLDIDTSNLVNNKPVYYYSNKVGLNKNNFTNAGQVILVNCNKSVISNLTISTATRGFYLYHCHNNTIINNVVSNNVLDGILLRNSNDNKIIKNNISDSYENGIYLVGCKGTDIISNNLTLNDIGVKIIESSNNSFSNNYFYSKNGLGVRLSSYNNSFYNNTFYNCAIYCEGGSIDALSSHFIDTSNTINGKSIYYFVNKTNLDESDYPNPGYLFIVNCNDSLISQVNISHATSGLVMFYCKNFTIIKNKFSSNVKSGIEIYNCENILISSNEIANNRGRGILLYYSCKFITLYNNEIHNNFEGIVVHIEPSNNPEIFLLNNIITRNQNGICLQYCKLSVINLNLIINNDIGIWMRYNDNDNNTIRNNLIKDNEIGAYITSGERNLFFNNTFIQNSINAYDSVDNTLWDNGSIGNYWSDYSGKDMNDDGIGDEPYNISGTSGNIDNFPIWWDPPIISIKSPIMNSTYDDSPTFNISIDEGKADAMWYSLDEGLTNKTLNDVIGKLDQTLWNMEEDGLVSINFYINDSRDYIGFAKITVFKDAIPQIIINSPSIDDIFGSSAPEFNITINDLSPINSTWYTIDAGAINYTFSGLTSIINQSAWEQKEDGVITIRFYANDSAGNLGFKEINVTKDTTAPKITINTPTPFQLCGITTINFSLSIDEPNIQTKQYSLNGRPNITYTAETHFSQSEWNNVGNGTVSIIFYVIDSVGNVNSSEVIVRKDTYIPDITIHSPVQDEKYRSIPPVYNISIIEENLLSTWYTIEGIAGTFSFSELTGTIDQDAWTDTPEGEITITFYAIDGAGNIGNESVTVIKSIPSQPAIPGYNLVLLIGAISIVAIITMKRLYRYNLF